MSTLHATIYSEEIYQVPSRTTIILASPSSALPEDQQLLLTKILKAVDLTLDGVQVVQQSAFDLSVFAVKPSRVIAFTGPPKGVGLYEVYPVEGTAIVFADSLEILTRDDQAKRKLWTALKEQFLA